VERVQRGDLDAGPERVIPGVQPVAVDTAGTAGHESFPVKADHNVFIVPYLVDELRSIIVL
jgi:hypothetical protein